MEKRGLKYHRGRLGEALREEIETLVEGELADPRIGLVRVTAVHVADDGRSVRLDRSEREKARVEELLARAKKRMKQRSKSGEKKA